LSYFDIKFLYIYILSAIKFSVKLYVELFKYFDQTNHKNKIITR